LSVPLGLFFSVTLLFCSIGLATKESRTEITLTLNNINLGDKLITRSCEKWIAFYRYLFGSRYLSKRQLLTIPIYTYFVSAICFGIWIIYILLFQNPKHLLLTGSSLPLSLAVKQFYPDGLLASITLDIIVINYTKYIINKITNKDRGILFISIAITFGVFMSYILFTIVCFGFRLWDMLMIYTEMAPNDPIRTMPYHPFEDVSQYIHLFEPRTLLHVTTNGTFSSYFMPEPIILYSVFASQITLVFTAIGLYLSSKIKLFRVICIRFVEVIDSPKAHAISTIIVVFLIALFLLIAIAALISPFIFTQ
jgi:hypothetical protein